MRNIENRNDPTSMIKLYRIARELGVTVDEIIAPDDAESPTDDEPPANEPHRDGDRHARVRTITKRTRLR